MLDTKLGAPPDWTSVFVKYDINANSYLTKNELQQMIIDSGMKHVNTAETAYAFNVINKGYQTTGITLKTFRNWGRSMEGTHQKQLIQYSEYLNIATMKMETPEEQKRKAGMSTKFLKMIKG